MTKGTPQPYAGSFPAFAGPDSSSFTTGLDGQLPGHAPGAEVAEVVLHGVRGGSAILRDLKDEPDDRMPTRSSVIRRTATPWLQAQWIRLIEGVPAECLDRLARTEDPRFKAEDERIFFQFAHEMLQEHFVSPATFTGALKLFGEDGVLDLIGSIGGFDAW
jgi:hypothetical protein